MRTLSSQATQDESLLLLCSRDDMMQGVSDRRLLALPKSVAPKIPSRDGLDSFPNSNDPRGLSVLITLSPSLRGLSSQAVNNGFESFR
jgi:hypothetical protein